MKHKFDNLATNERLGQLPHHKQERDEIKSYVFHRTTRRQSNNLERVHIKKSFQNANESEKKFHWPVLYKRSGRGE